MQRQTTLFTIGFLALVILATGCGPTEQAQDPQVLAQRAEFLLAEEPEGAMSIMAAKAAVEKGETVVLVGRIDAEPWDEGHAAFFITDAFSAKSTSHVHDGAKHERHSDEHEADEHEADEHEADEHKADEHKADEHEVGGHKADEHEGHEHEGDEHAADEREADEHEGDAHEAHGAGGHDPSNCPFCSSGKDSSRRAFIQFVDETGHMLHTDARDLLGVEKGQVVVVRGRGKIENSGYLIVSADGIYLRE
jgi:hypothetical protein